MSNLNPNGHTPEKIYAFFPPEGSTPTLIGPSGYCRETLGSEWKPVPNQPHSFPCQATPGESDGYAEANLVPSLSAPVTFLFSALSTPAPHPAQGCQPAHSFALEEFACQNA